MKFTANTSSDSLTNKTLTQEEIRRHQNNVRVKRWREKNYQVALERGREYEKRTKQNERQRLEKLRLLEQREASVDRLTAFEAIRLNTLAVVKKLLGI